MGHSSDVIHTKWLAEIFVSRDGERKNLVSDLVGESEEETSCLWSGGEGAQVPQLLQFGRVLLEYGLLWGDRFDPE